MKDDKKVSHILQLYLQWPVFLTALVILAGAAVNLISRKAGFVMIAFTVIYAACAGTLYMYGKKRALGSLVSFASAYSWSQKQLLAFARTFVSMPGILILDEATSSIDTKTELLVQKGIETLLKGRTSFVIAHRLSTIQKADRIFVIDEGGIMEQGTAKELLAKKGAYYDLYMAQFAV